MPDWKEKVPLVHYSNVFAALDRNEIAARCNIACVPQTEAGCRFLIRLMGKEYAVEHPVFAVSGPDELSVSEKIIILRYLCEGRYIPFAGKALSYREIPWGELYFRNFEGRCIFKIRRLFGDKPEALEKIMIDGGGALKAEKLPQSSFAWRFEFISNLYISVLLWPGDDEFPASAQVLFDDNVSAAFSAEDLAFVGEIVAARLKTANEAGN
ncbi:MAG: DUF3786 domain-containing protein [Spirochaetaceae bacterium]|jgi:hypothetical protein|nr:DUF3786 domain-containing protein [Spirochaetaceae bacterium]